MNFVVRIEGEMVFQYFAIPWIIFDNEHLKLTHTGIFVVRQRFSATGNGLQRISQIHCGCPMEVTSKILSFSTTVFEKNWLTSAFYHQFAKKLFACMGFPVYQV
jgi:hypothetical protein